MQEISEITRGLKALAKELERAGARAVAILARGRAARGQAAACSSDLRESGSIEQDADVVMFIYPRGILSARAASRARRRRKRATNSTSATSAWQRAHGKKSRHRRSHRRQAAPRPDRQDEAAIRGRDHQVRQLLPAARIALRDGPRHSRSGRCLSSAARPSTPRAPAPSSRSISAPSSPIGGCSRATAAPAALRRGGQGRRLRSRRGAGGAARCAAAGCRRFFVATLDEGLALRAALVPERRDRGASTACCRAPAADFAAARLIPVLNDPGQIDDLGARSARRRAPPMRAHRYRHGRLGLRRREFERLPPTAPRGRRRWPHADQPPRLRRSSRTHALNAAQRARFRRRACSACRPRRQPRRLLGHLPRAATIHFDLVRPGAALYGVNPLPGHPQPDAASGSSAAQNPAGPRN